MKMKPAKDLNGLTVEQVMFPSGNVRCSGELFLPDTIREMAPIPGLILAIDWFNRYIRNSRLVARSSKAPVEKLV